MFKLGNKNSIVLTLKDEFIDIIVGNKKRIKLYDSIPIEEGLCIEGSIKNEERLSQILLTYFLENDIKEDDISFVVFGSDVVTRYLRLPNMKGKNLREAIEFEVKELIQNGEEYYIDYEIIGKEKETKNPQIDVLVAACIKSKIDDYVSLSKSLGKNLKVIDVLTNTINKILINSDLDYKNKTIALFYLGYSFSSVSIVDDGIMMLERNIPFGFKNIIREYKKSYLDFDAVKDIDTYNNSISLLGPFEELPRIKDIVDNVLSIVSRTIKFYDSNRDKNNVGEIIIVNSLELNNLNKKYIRNYFTIRSKVVDNIEELGLDIKNVDKRFGRFLPLYGLFLRRH